MEVQHASDVLSIENLVSTTETSPKPAIETSKRVTSSELHDEPAHTDSMVTIRLSGVPASRKSVSFSPLIPSTEDAEESAPQEVGIRRHSTAMAPFPELEEEESSAQDEATLVDAQSLSSAENNLHTVDPKTDKLSIATAVEDSEGFGLELRRASRQSSRSSSTGSVSSNESGNRVDWEQLDKNEEAEVRDEATDESTAFLLARLDRENQILSLDPKAQPQIDKSRSRGQSRPPSLQQLKRMATEPNKATLRYSLLPSPPPMTELEFWSALVRDYAQTAQRLPTLTSNKVRAGIPPPLRGVVWVSIAGARDPHLDASYDRLCNEISPYEKLIDKDLGRSYPGVDMFRDPGGDGQKMLGKVLNAYSLWDEEIGYCQGLGFVVGPLIMHMSDKDSFCVLVKLMQSYDLRNCFLPDLSGLHLRIYQFQNLLGQHLPDLTAHLDKLKVEPLYVSQWFLSFFGVNCPLPMLIRIYDILLTEGASETLMRVALSLMRRNEQKILALNEFEDVMGLLLSRGLWDTYNCNADDLVNDFVGWTGLVTREGLLALEASFQEQSTGKETKSTQKVESAAARFLGRFWASSSPSQSPSSKTNATSPTLATPTQQPKEDVLKRTPSKQSMASTLNSVESVDSTSSQSTAATEVSMSRQQSGDFKPGHAVKPSISVRSIANQDRDLHTQIEDLLMAMNDLQREQTMLANELQREREERDEDRAVVGRVLERLRRRDALTAQPEDDKLSSSDESDSTVTEDPVVELENHFSSTKSKRSSLVQQTKLQLRDEVSRWKVQYNEELARSSAMSNQLTEREREANQVKDELREARARIADAHRDKQRLEKANRELRERTGPSPRGSVHSMVPDPTPTPKTSGLREFRLGRTNTSEKAPTTTFTASTPTFNKRTSSLSAHSILASSDVDSKPAPAVDTEALLAELVQAKTAEAVARQELEEVKGKLDSLRRMMSGKAANPGLAKPMGISSNHSPGKLSFSGAIGMVKPEDARKELEEKKLAMPPTTGTGGGWFWGKRAASGSAGS